MGRKFIGFDHSEEWVEKASARIQSVEHRFGELSETWDPRACAMKSEEEATI